MSLLSFATSARPADATPRRIHIVCPANGACTALALLLCELLDAGCASDFSCLMPRFWDAHHLQKVLLPTATHTGDVRKEWQRRGANLVVKDTISAEVASALRALDRDVRLPAAAVPSYRMYRELAERSGELGAPAAPGRHAAAAEASGGGDRGGGAIGVFTHRVLFLRDPVQQYLSVRVKYWCANCGGFLSKLQAQERLLRGCLSVARRLPSSSSSAAAAGSSAADCPFDVVLFDRDVYAAIGRGELPQLLASLGLLPAALAGGNGTGTPLRVHDRARRARNAALGLSAKLVNRGNMRGNSLQPRLATRRRSWSCSVATRVQALLPTLYRLYHPQHCRGPRVLNESDAEVSDAIDPATGRRHATSAAAAAESGGDERRGRRGRRHHHHGHPRHQAAGRRRTTESGRRPLPPLVCDGTEAPSDGSDCAASTRGRERVTCEAIQRMLTEERAPA